MSTLLAAEKGLPVKATQTELEFQIVSQTFITQDISSGIKCIQHFISHSQYFPCNSHKGLKAISTLNILQLVTPPTFICSLRIYTQGGHCHLLNSNNLLRKIFYLPKYSHPLEEKKNLSVMNLQQLEQPLYLCKKKKRR